LVANGRRRKNTFSLLPTVPQQILLKPSIFSFDLKVLLYHGSGLLLMHSLPFPWPINYNSAYWCNKFSTHSLLIWFWLKIFFISLKSWHCIWPHVTGLKLHKWMKNHLRSHL
jgi:hypothetical protein